MAYYKNGAFAADPWAAREVLSVSEWRERRDGDLPDPLALQLDPGFAVETVAADLDKIDLIKIVFPKFTDGRGYSMGSLLRTRFSYTGEMRAIGDVLFDEMPLMVRCGFDAFEIIDLASLRLLEEGRQPVMFDRFYQPGVLPDVPVGTRPWARRPV